MGNPFEVMRKVRKVFGKVDTVKVTRSGMVLILCVSKEQRECALWFAKLSTDEVDSFDRRNMLLNM